MTNNNPPTQKEIGRRLVEMRGRSLNDSIVQATITDTVFGESENVYLSRIDAENWRSEEFVFVIPSNVSSVESMLARGYWAQTAYFELPVIL